jgi:hypothetical protein
MKIKRLLSLHVLTILAYAFGILTLVLTLFGLYKNAIILNIYFFTLGLYVGGNLVSYSYEYLKQNSTNH